MAGGDQPGDLDTTEDHLVHRNSTGARPRPIKAAHTVCNHARHHYPLDHPIVVAHVEFMHRVYGEGMGPGQPGGIRQEMAPGRHNRNHEPRIRYPALLGVQDPEATRSPDEEGS